MRPGSERQDEPGRPGAGFERPLIRVSLGAGGRRTTATAVPEPASTMYVRCGKRLMDLVVGSLALVLAAPLLICAAGLLRLTLGAGVTFRQPRVGRYGQDFEMIKLRTMRHSRRTAGPAAFDGPDRRRTHKSSLDPRHTRLGRWFRKLSIDELPQLLHVVKGEMSLVGPRPELSKVVDRHQLRGHERHKVRPGLTGTWQITHRSSGIPLHECFDDDIAYVRNVTFRTDLRIIRATLGAIVRGTGS